MSNTYFKSGDWSVICDSCGFKFKASQLRKRWDGFYVCAADWEPRHPMDFLKTPDESKPLPWTRPEPTDTFIAPTYIATTVGNQDTTVPSSSFHAAEDPELP